MPWDWTGLRVEMTAMGYNPAGTTRLVADREAEVLVLDYSVVVGVPA